MSDKFEHKMQQLLGNIELEPTEAVWQNVKHEITPAKRRRYVMFWWVLPFVLIGAGVLYLKTNNNNHRHQQTSIRYAENKTTSATTYDKAISTVVGSGQLHHHDATTGKLLRSVVIIKPATITNVKTVRKNVRKTNPYITTEVAAITTQDKKATVTSDQTTAVPVDDTGTINNNGVIITTGTTGSKKNIRPADTSVSVSPVPVIPAMNKQNKHHWQWGIITEAGVSTNAGNAFTSRPMNVSLASGSPVSGSSAAYNFEEKQNQVNALMAIGVTAKRSVSGKIDMNTSFTYLYQSFAVKTTRYKDSLGRYPVYNASSVFDLNFINVAAGVNWYPARYGHNRFGAGISLDNMYLLKATNTFITQSTYGNISSGLGKDHSLSSYNKWQPNLNISLTAAFTTTSKTVIQLSPFVRYALRELNNTGQDRVRLLGFGLNARYYFR
jgi:hypothetical protein